MALLYAYTRRELCIETAGVRYLYRKGILINQNVVAKVKGSEPAAIDMCLV